MIPPLLIGLGALALAVGWAVLRSFGPGYRVGRLLSATPWVSVEEAAAMAARGEARYVSVRGRIDSETDFEDEHHRPLVLRRVRLEARRGRRWEVIDDRREAVSFEIRDGLASIGVDHGALDEGLVVIPRESSGVAGDVPGMLPGDLAADTPLRMRVEQVSSVEQAMAVGVPAVDSAGRPCLTSGLGRPLILTTLERDEAMRVLARGSRVRPAAAAVALFAGTALMAIGLVWGMVALGQGAAGTSGGAGASGGGSGAAVGGAATSPAVTGAPESGDTRSPGQGPGFVGAPLLAVGGVLAIGLGAAALTLLYVRLTGGPGEMAGGPGAVTDVPGAVMDVPGAVTDVPGAVTGGPEIGPEMPARPDDPGPRA